GNSPIAGIVHALVLVLVLVLLAPLAVYIPLASLAAVLFVVAWNMSQPKLVWRLIKESPRVDVFILLVTLALTVFVNLVVAVNICVALAMLHFLQRMSSSVRVERLRASQLRALLGNEVDQSVNENDIAVISVEGPF